MHIDQAQNLRNLVKKSKEVRVISVASGKGGVGKTYISVNLAIALSRYGINVLIVDADFGLANVDIMLGVTSKFDVSYFLRREKTLGEIIQLGHEGVRFISGGSGINTLLNMGEDQLSELLSGIMGLDTPVDIIILDAGAGINDNVMQLILASSETIIVTTTEPTAILDAYALVKTIVKRDNTYPLHVVINKCDNIKEGTRVQTGFIDVVGRNLGKNINPLGFIMQDQNVPLSVKRQLPIIVSNPICQTSREISAIARAILDISAPPKTNNLLSKIFSRLTTGGITV